MVESAVHAPSKLSETTQLKLTSIKAQIQMREIFLRTSGGFDSSVPAHYGKLSLSKLPVCYTFPDQLQKLNQILGRASSLIKLFMAQKSNQSHNL